MDAAPTPSVASLARAAMHELDSVVSLVRDMLQLFSSTAPQDGVAPKDRLLQLGQRYKAHSSALRHSIQRIAQAQQQQAGQPAQPPPHQPHASGTDAAATVALSAELEQLKQTVRDKNDFLFQLITQLREMLDTIVMWETYGRNLSQDTGKKHERR